MLCGAKQAPAAEIAEACGVLWCPCDPLKLEARALLDRDGGAWVELQPFKQGLGLRWQSKTFKRVLGEQRLSTLQGLQTKLLTPGALDCLSRKEREAYWLRLDALRPLIELAVQPGAPLRGRLLTWLERTLARRVSEARQLCQGNGDDSDAGSDADSDSDGDFYEGEPQAAAAAQLDRGNAQALEE
eukprot:15484997-Alexandrium_andersonii.AAC.1